MKFRLVAVALAAASFTEAAPIKRGLLEDLFGLDGTTTTTALAGAQVAAAAPTSTQVTAPAAAPTITTSNTGGFWANLFEGFGSGSDTTAAQPQVQAAAQVTTPAVAQAISTSASTPASSSDRKSTRLNSSHIQKSRMPSSA